MMKSFIDWHEVPQESHIHIYSVNGVPWPHEEWLKLQNKMTVKQAVELTKRWPKCSLS